MPSSSDHRHRVRSVRLPSGRTVEVVFFSSEKTPPALVDLNVCPACGGTFAYPTGWHEAGPAHWEVSRRCPSCEWRGTAVHHQALVDRFDELLDLATDGVLANLGRMTRANMEDELLRFTRELGAGRIGAEDFRDAQA